ncbi:hypothetical protein LR48_Vigan205s001600 [Vigna angularis]|uniref:Uncharacterized protein n=1 Tax=Phaseolus angularis TaxID=3914 RepID=A0A0L9T6Z6_PHAAN|nr:hypothetical protein LR48_Vigan205s001600 [Vigna angularis]
MPAMQGSNLTRSASTFWNSLLAHWNSAEFRNKCVTTQKNKASKKGDTLHTSGSMTVHKHVIRMEEFSTRLSQIRSRHGSAPAPDVVTNEEDNDIRRTQCWVYVVGGKKKGRVYSVGQLAANYIVERGGTLKHQPSSSTPTTNEAVEHLTQLLQQRDQECRDLREEYSELRDEFTNFKSLVMRALPDTSQLHSTVPPTQPRPSPSPAVPQQPISVQPTSVHPYQSNSHQSIHLQSSRMMKIILMMTV